MTDPIADMLIRIKNAYRASKATVNIPFSKIKWNIAEILKEEGCVAKVMRDEKNSRIVTVDLAYRTNREGAIRDVSRVSKPGRRVYSDSTHLPEMKKTFGFAIISTPQGLMTGFEAKRRNIGGEIICKIFTA